MSIRYLTLRNVQFLSHCLNLIHQFLLTHFMLHLLRLLSSSLRRRGLRLYLFLNVGARRSLGLLLLLILLIPTISLKHYILLLYIKIILIRIINYSYIDLRLLLLLLKMYIISLLIGSTMMGGVIIFAHHHLLHDTNLVLQLPLINEALTHIPIHQLLLLLLPYYHPLASLAVP
jgi:hypothetical protein